MVKLTNNRHPVDELADIREQMKPLKQREEELRQMILDGECEAEGNEYVATVTVAVREKLDEAKLKKELGMAMLRPFVRASEIKTVRLKEK